MSVLPTASSKGRLAERGTRWSYSSTGTQQGHGDVLQVYLLAAQNQLVLDELCCPEVHVLDELAQKVYGLASGLSNTHFSMRMKFFMDKDRPSCPPC